MPPGSDGYNFCVSIAKLSALVAARKSARGRPMQQITAWLERLDLGGAISRAVIRSANSTLGRTQGLRASHPSGAR